MLSDWVINLFDILSILILICAIGFMVCLICTGICYIIICITEEIQDYRATHPKSLESETDVILTYGDIEHKFYEQNPSLQHLHSDYRPCGLNSIIIWFKTKIGIIVRYDEDNNKFEIIKIDKSENL